MYDIQKIVGLIDAYAKDTNTNRTAFGLKLLNRPNFVHQLAREEISPTLRTMTKVVDFLKENGYTLQG